MPQVVADFLEGEVAGDEMCRAGMPERVRTSMRAGIPHLGQARARQMIEGAGGEGTDRRAERQEDLRPCPAWPDLLQIPGSVSKVEMAVPMALIYKVLFPSISTFETPPGPE